MKLGAFAFGGLIAVIVCLFMLALSTDAPKDLDPAKVCREHHGVQHVYATGGGGTIQGVVCRDGHWERRH